MTPPPPHRNPGTPHKSEDVLPPPPPLGGDLDCTLLEFYGIDKLRRFIKRLWHTLFAKRKKVAPGKMATLAELFDIYPAIPEPPEAPGYAEMIR